MNPDPPALPKPARIELLGMAGVMAGWYSLGKFQELD
jgi:hypothetical protein